MTRSRDPTRSPAGETPSHKEFPYETRQNIHVTSIDSKYYPKIESHWTTDRQALYDQQMKNWRVVTLQTGVTQPEEEPAEGEQAATPQAAPPKPPTGPGWVIELKCFHYFNDNDAYFAAREQHVLNVMTTSFLRHKVRLPAGVDPAGNELFEEFTMEQMGLKYPLLVSHSLSVERIPNPDYDQTNETADLRDDDDVPDEDEEEPDFEVERMDFTFQIIWQEVPRSERLELLEAEREKARQEAEQRAEDSVAARVP